MKIWKIFLLATLFVAISGLWLWRWHLTMEEAIIVPDAVYLVGEEVAFGKNFFWDDSENSDGYLLSVQEATVRKRDDFLTAYGASASEEFSLEIGEGEYKMSDYVYDVTVTIKNQSNETGGVRFSDFILIRDALILRLDTDLIQLSEPDLAGLTGFSMPVGKERTFHFPFTPDPGVLAVDETSLYQAMKQDIFFLCISQFPVRTVIKLA